MLGREIINICSEHFTSDSFLNLGVSLQLSPSACPSVTPLVNDEEMSSSASAANSGKQYIVDGIEVGVVDVVAVSMDA